ncbi:Mitochondrial intermembrane space import and assembly protein 40 homolog [Linum grandiflorum]
MGQAQSEPSITTAEEKIIKPQESSRATSMGSLIAEAAAFGESVDESESLDSKAEKALECPCLSELRNGECGAQFSDAFLCFLKSTSEAKGSDCVHPFVALQKCIKLNPGAFSNKADVAEEGKEVKKVEMGVQKYRISAPLWAREPSTPKPKL